MFAAVVERLRSGEAYYEAMGAELRRRDYPTRDGLQLADAAAPHHGGAGAVGGLAWRAHGLLVAVFVATMLRLAT